MKKFYFDAGLDPNFRIAENVHEMNGQKEMCRLSRFAAYYGIPGEFDARFAQSGKETDGALIGAAILRDCFGKINYFFAPVCSPFFTGIAKMLKAYRKDIHIIAVASDNAEMPLQFDAVDEIIRVDLKEISEMITQAEALEDITIGPDSASVLAAAKNTAVSLKNRHNRYVVLLTE